MTKIQTKNCGASLSFVGPTTPHTHYIHTHGIHFTTVVLVGRSLEGACAIGVGKKPLRGETWRTNKEALHFEWRLFESFILIGRNKQPASHPHHVTLIFFLLLRRSLQSRHLFLSPSLFPYLEEKNIFVSLSNYLSCPFRPFSPFYPVFPCMHWELTLKIFLQPKRAMTFAFSKSPTIAI